MPIAMVISGKPASIAYAGAAGSGVITATNTYSFAGAAIGTAATGRLVVVAVSYASAAAATCTCTIGGNAATEIAGCAKRGTSGGSVEIQVRMFKLVVDTGTTATIVVNTSSNAVNFNVAVWAAYDLISTTPVDATSYDAPANTSILDVNTSPGGVACGYIWESNTPVSWSGMTEDFDAIVGSIWQSGASVSDLSGHTPLTVRVTDVGAFSGAMSCAASFR